MFQSPILVALILANVAGVEPIPKESEAAKIKRDWGEFDDAKSGAKVKLVDGKLHIQVPAGIRVPDPQISIQRMAPSIMKTVRGEFVATVTIHQHRPPPNSVAADSNKAPLGPLTSAGFLVEFDKNTKSNFARATVSGDGFQQFQSMFRFSEGTSSSAGGVSTEQAKIERVKLRLTRTEEELKNEYSYDEGKTWKTFSIHLFSSSGEVRVGIFAGHGVETETTAIFEKFELTKPKK